MRVLFIGTDCIGNWEDLMDGLDAAFVDGYGEPDLNAPRNHRVLSACRRYGSVGDALAAHRPELVVVGVPNYRKNRTEYELQALPSADLYIHKFRLASYNDLDALRAAAREAGRDVFVGETYRRAPAVQAAARLLAEGSFGAPECAFWDCHLPHPEVHDWERAYDALALEDLALHHLSALDALIGLHATRVYAQTCSPRKANPIKGTVSAMILTLASGATVTHRIDWHNSGADTGYFGNALIECERGFVRIAGDRVTCGQWGELPRDVPVCDPAVNPAVNPAEETLRYLRAGKTGVKPYDIEAHARVLRVIKAALQSARSGEAVTCQDE